MDDVERLSLRVLAVVGIGQAVGDFGNQVDRNLDRDLLATRGAAIDQRAQRHAVDVLERDVVARGCLSEIQDACDVPVFELARDARFVLE